MTKADLSNYIQEHFGDLSLKQSAELVEVILNIIKQTLAGGENVKISGFGRFIVRDKLARTGRNLKSGAPLIIEARRVVTFKASQKLKDAILEKKSRK